MQVYIAFSQQSSYEFRVIGAYLDEKQAETAARPFNGTVRRVSLTIWPYSELTMAYREGGFHSCPPSTPDEIKALEKPSPPTSDVSNITQAQP